MPRVYLGGATAGAGTVFPNAPVFCSCGIWTEGLRRQNQHPGFVMFYCQAFGLPLRSPTMRKYRGKIA